MKLTIPAFVGRIAFSALAALIGAVFALPLLWFLFAPFNARAELGLALPDPWTLNNFVTVFGNSYAVQALWNSFIQAVGGVILVGAAATLAAYALSRSSIPGKGAVTYILLLFSSVVSGSAAMVPIFLIVSAAVELLGRKKGVLGCEQSLWLSFLRRDSVSSARRARRPRLPMAQLLQRRMPTTARSSRSWAVAAAAGTVGRAEDAVAIDRKLSKRFGP